MIDYYEVITSITARISELSTRLQRPPSWDEVERLRDLRFELKMALTAVEQYEERLFAKPSTGDSNAPR